MCLNHQTPHSVRNMTFEPKEESGKCVFASENTPETAIQSELIHTLFNLHGLCCVESSSNAADKRVEGDFDMCLSAFAPVCFFYAGFIFGPDDLEVKVLSLKLVVCGINKQLGGA